MKSRTAVILLTTFSVGAPSASASVLFQDAFNTPGTHLDLSRWTTEMGAPSFLGRTQLADCVTPGPGGTFAVGANGAELALNTWNPSGNANNPTLFGTHGK